MKLEYFIVIFFCATPLAGMYVFYRHFIKSYKDDLSKEIEKHGFKYVSSHYISVLQLV